MRTTSLLVCALLLPLSAAAQTPETSAKAPDDLRNLPVPSWGQAILDSFSKPVHPIVGGVASGGGLGFGVGYDSPRDERWYQEAEAIGTVRRYWSLEGEVGRRSISTGSRIGAFAGVRHMGRLDYYGIGPDTVVEDRTSFRLRETTVGARGWYRLAPPLRLGGTAALYVPDLGRGANRAVPSIEEVFPVSSVPGYSAEPSFGRYRGLVEFQNPANAGTADGADRFHGTYQLALEAVRDLDTGRHNFRRWEVELQQRTPGVRPGHRLTLHGLVAATNSDADVPFYMLYTLGGGGGLKSFRPDMLGTDGTRDTLRGFRNFRFRDRNLLLMQAEYRIPLHRYVHSTVFIDAGQVAPDTSELFDDLRTSVGFSLGYVRGDKTLGRMDVGFGGGEGVRVFWSFGVFD
jgi:hypothetical protein